MTNDERTKADVLQLMREATSRPGQSLAEAMYEAAAEIERLRDRLKSADEEIKDLRHQGGEDWALMAADVR